MRDPRSQHLARYKTHRARRGTVGWNDGPTNAMDRLLDHGLSAIEISYRLDVDRWVVLERFEARARLEQKHT